jgi:hypothetical protein
MWRDVEDTFRGGFHEVALAVAAFLPGVLAMLFVLAFTLGLALLVRFGLRRSLAGVDFDRRVHRWGFTSTGEWLPRNSPTSIAANVGFWTVMFVGFLAGLRALHTAPTDALAADALAYLPHLVSAVVVIFAGLATARFLERAVLINAVNMQIRQARVLSLGTKWLVVLFATALALQQLRVGGAVLTISFAIVFGGIVLALALAVGLGSREAVSRSSAQKHPEKQHDEKQAEAEVEAADEIHHM